MGLLKDIVGFIKDQWKVSKARRILIIVAALLLATFAAIYFLFFYMVGDKTVYEKYVLPWFQKNDEKTSQMKCSTPTFQAFISDGEPYSQRDYVGQAIAANLDQTALNKTSRLKFIKSLLTKVDSALAANQLEPYGLKLYSFIRDTDQVSAEIFNTARNLRILYVQETLDTINCQYSLKINLAKSGAEEMDNIITLISNRICIAGVIERMIKEQLSRRGEACITLQAILTNLCSSCPNTTKIKEMIAQCPDSHNCDDIYFERGQYRLSPISQQILESLCMNLSLNYIIEFHGFTDPDLVKTRILVNSDDNIYVASNGVLLCDKISANNVRLLTTISNNDDLSFARAFSCYKYVKRKFNGNIQMYYTGHGVCPENSQKQQQRTVEITIKPVTHGITSH